MNFFKHLLTAVALAAPYAVGLAVGSAQAAVVTQSQTFDFISTMFSGTGGPKAPVATGAIRRRQT